MSTAQWANIGDDPGALHALVERIPEHAPVPAIDYLWIFPSRRIAIGESIVIVIGLFDEDPERRRVSTALFTISRNRKGAATVNSEFHEHGSAPVAAVPRIVQGVLRRLGEDTEGSPREEQIRGDQKRWDELVVELGGTPRTDAPDSMAGAADVHEPQPPDMPPESGRTEATLEAALVPPAAAEIDDAQAGQASDEHPPA